MTSVVLPEALIPCLQMHSAFWRGAVHLKKELDSSIALDVGQHQGELAASSGPSTDLEGFSELPRNVMCLEGVIGKLTTKVAHR